MFLKSFSEHLGHLGMERADGVDGWSGRVKSGWLMIWGPEIIGAGAAVPKSFKYLYMIKINCLLEFDSDVF